MTSKVTTGIAVWLALLAGVVYVLGGLRDIFAPDFFKARRTFLVRVTFCFSFSCGNVYRHRPLASGKLKLRAGAKK